MRNSKQAAVPGGVMLSIMMRKVRVLPYGFFFCGKSAHSYPAPLEKDGKAYVSSAGKRDPSRLPLPFGGKENGIFREVNGMMMNDYDTVKGFTFWDSWHKQCKLLNDEDRLAYTDAIRTYAFEGLMPSQDDVSPMVYALFLGAVPSIDANLSCRHRGGQPGNQNARKTNKNESKNESKNEKTTNRIQNSELEQQNLEFKNSECSNERECVGKDRGLRGEGKPGQRFTPPSSDDVAEWLWAEKGMAMTEAGPLADRFVSFYESKGWMVGKNRMKSWKAAVSGWLARDRQECQKKQAEAYGASDGVLYLKQVVGDV